MKFLCLGDCHFMYRSPRGRTDNIFETQLDKLDQVLEIGNVKGSILLQVGDLFHRPRTPDIVKSGILKLLCEYGVQILTVLGQHDTYHHSLQSFERTPTNVLVKAGFAELLVPDKPIIVGEEEGNVVEIYGASYGQEPVKPGNSSNTKILVAHVSVGDKQLFPGHELMPPNAYARKYPWFDFILLGDYHYPFYSEYKDTIIVNVGAMTRLTTKKQDQELKPQVGIYDSCDRTWSVIPLQVKEAADVFYAGSTRDADVKHAPALEEFLQRLQQSGEIGVSFTDNLEEVMKQENTSDAVRSIVSDVLEKVGD